eukprot:4103787-Prorocentrum_lima.AAC.1
MQPKLRNPTSTWDIVDFVMIMTRAVGVRALEEDVESRMRPALSNRFAVTNLAANSMSANPAAARVEGVTRKVCQRFVSDQGCLV